MAIVRTKKISIYIPAGKISEAAEFLQESGIFEPAGEKRFIPEGIAGSIVSKMQKTENALAVLSKYSPQKRGLLLRRTHAEHSALASVRAETKHAASKVGEILSLSEKIAHTDSAVSEAEETIRALMPYKSLNTPLCKTETAHTVSLAGSCNPLATSEIAENIKNSGARIYFKVLSRTKRECFIWLVYLKCDKDKTEEFLSEIHFKQAAVSARKFPPTEEIAHLEQKCRRLRNYRKSLAERIISAAKYRKQLELYYDILMLKHGKYLALSSAENTATVFAVTGYVPEESAETFVQTVERKFSAIAETEEPQDGEILPVMFKNNAFVSPVEEITASYSMPSETDIDPNPIMAVFYYWFFGMMFSDAGYGILMMAVCGILGFSRCLEQHRRKKFRMFFWCGISTTLWGIAYGSFFGDLISVISDTFGSGGTEFTPLLFDPVNRALELLIISVGFGTIHIITALALKFYTLWKSGNRKNAVRDAGFWIAVIAGLCIFATGTGLNSAAVRNFGIILSSAAAAGLVLTGGKNSQNPIIRLFSGILSLYDITSFVGDILSYSRLMALGLATGVIASVVNILGALGGNTPAGVIMFAVVAIFGHSLNFAINMLGAYVHTNRLQYVEFYQKFYTGGGKRFNPLRPDTKYFNFTDS